MIGKVFTTTDSKKEYLVIDGHPMFGGAWRCYPTDKPKPYKQSLIECFSTEFIEKCLKQTHQQTK